VGMKILHFSPLLFVYSIVVSVFYSYTKYFFLQGNFTPIKILTSPLFFYCALMTVVNHTLSIITDPGKIETNFSIKEAKFLEDPKLKEQLFCKKCNRQRPERCHHCKVCDRCVLKMDHHCPWVANCVGLRNQKYFYLFLFYATVGNLIAFLSMVPLAFKIDTTFKLDDNNNLYAKLFDPIMLIVGLLLSLSMTLSIGLLFGAQTYMIMYNTTTIENRKYQEKNDNPYYSNNKLFNLSIVLGLNSKWEWLTPIVKDNPYNNGHSYLKYGETYQGFDLIYDDSEKKDYDNEKTGEK